MEFILVSLAVFRLAYMVSQEQGPNYIFDKFRKWSTNHLYPWFDADCPHCTAVWIALPLAFVLDTTWFVIVYWLAIAAVASLLVSLINWIQD